MWGPDEVMSVAVAEEVWMDLSATHTANGLTDFHTAEDVRRAVNYSLSK